jgi:hypothetical protein
MNFIFRMNENNLKTSTFSALNKLGIDPKIYVTLIEITLFASTLYAL